jgi:chemotaxis protein methyltransferase CheR
MTSELSQNDSLMFREYFYRKTGIRFDSNKRYFVDKRLIERINTSGCQNFHEYFTRLRFQANGEELQHLTNQLTVNETCFMREEYQFHCLTQSILPELIAHHPHDRVINIWCMPSSSGEEPYSIAMYLLEFWPELQQHDVRLLASDINTQVLDMAEEGIYCERSMRYVPAAWKSRYFSRSGDFYHLSEELRSCVEFSHVNLMNNTEVRRQRNIDVVFCRNLLIYFDDVSRKEAAEALYDVMSPGGFICLGHSESMGRISPLFKVRKFPTAIVYQKPWEES